MGPKGLAALHELRGWATRVMDEDAETDEALDFAARFLRAVDPHERDRVLLALRRELGPRLSFPSRPA